MWVYSVIGTSATIAAPTVTYTNATAPNYIFEDTLNKMQSPNNGETSVRFTMYGFVDITSQGCNISFSQIDGTLPSSTNSGEFWVTRIADSIIAAPTGV